jgi:hypothetical protein
LKNTEARIIEAFTKAVNSKEGLSWLRRAEFIISLTVKRREQYFTAEDIVYEIITKTIEGQRKWDIDKIPLSVYMARQIWSEVSNNLKRESRHTSADFQYDKEDSVSRKIFNEHSSGREETCEEYDWNEFISQCYKALEDDRECTALLKYILEGCGDGEAGKIPGLTHSEKNNIRKRLKRKLKRHFNVS